MAIFVGEVATIDGKKVRCVPSNTPDAFRHDRAWWVYAEEHHDSYKSYYPGGYTDCVKDQRCRGNPDPVNACTLLFASDASQIKKEAGMGKSVISDWLSGDNCSAVFSATRLGPKMQMTALSEPVIIKALTGRIGQADPVLGGDPVIDERSQWEQLPEYAENIKLGISGWKWPDFGLGWLKWLLPVIVILAVVMIFLVVLGKSGLGPAVGSHMMKKE